MNEPARRWLVFSDEDPRMAELALGERLWNQACFHSHQAAEKSLKAVVAGRGDNIPRTHRLTDLMSLLGENLREEIEDGLRSLEGFYIPTRYPDAVPGTLPEGLPGEEDAREAISVARKASKLAREMLGHETP